MSIWYPTSGITYSQYLQARSLVSDVSDQVKVSGTSLEKRISHETENLIANNEQLRATFKNGFDSLNHTLDWGLGRLEDGMLAVGASIDSLGANFEYSIGLLIERIDVNNKQLSSLLTKVDAIQKVIESPTLTRAREYYLIGCERLAKRLLDKSLEAFLEAEKLNDTDFFIQFRIGKLYLYGIDADDNVLDLEKARLHLLKASRYAEAEIDVDPMFGKYAAEALLHASISNYARLGNPEVGQDKALRSTLLQDALDLASKAIKINPDLAEAWYHQAKYLALFDKPQNSILSLEGAIVLDRNYTVKSEVDHVFDKVRPLVHDLFKKLYENKKVDCHLKRQQAAKLISELEEWKLEKDSQYSDDFRGLIAEMTEAVNYLNADTYYGYLDAESILNKITIEAPRLKEQRKEELRSRIEALLGSSKEESPQDEPACDDIRNGLEELDGLYKSVQKLIATDTFISYVNAEEIAHTALQKAKALNRLQIEEQKNRRDQEIEEERLEALKQRRREWSVQYAKSLAVSFAVFGGIIGTINCIVQGIQRHEGGLGMFSGALLGAIIGAIIGAIYGQLKH
ncbi:MAG: hypothetical protein MUQ00_10410 [Candidatus Aminicenantes bacterium]|nr:hypothetical protein [Candidatus Aminicenantes bacterium]